MRCQRAETQKSELIVKLENSEKLKEQFQKLYDEQIHEKNTTYERLPYLYRIIGDFERSGGQLSKEEVQAKRWFEIKHKKLEEESFLRAELNYSHKDL